MLRTKTMLLTVVVVALAVPSLWAQNKRTVGTPSPSLTQLKAELQARATALGVPAVCTASDTGSFPPPGYYPGTNKCSSGNANLGNGQSIQGPSATCADRAGVEGKWNPGGRNVELPAGVSGSPFSFWGSSFFANVVENQNPDVYGDVINIQTDTDLTLKNRQGVFGFEVSNSDPTVQTYSVTVHTTAGDVSVGPFQAGGSDPLLDPGAQRIVAVCNAPAITGVHISCTSCSDLSGDGKTGIAQIRGDKFKGF
jgi:hypothetical protein